MKMVKIPVFTRRSLRPTKCAILNRSLKKGEEGLFVGISTDNWSKGGRLELSHGAVQIMAKKFGMVDGLDYKEAEIEVLLLDAELKLAQKEIELLNEKLRVLFGQEAE